jgi:hypothetical protein
MQFAGVFFLLFSGKTTAFCLRTRTLFLPSPPPARPLSFSLALCFAIIPSCLPASPPCRSLSVSRAHALPHTPILPSSFPFAMLLPLGVFHETKSPCTHTLTYNEQVGHGYLPKP